jgi:hypothetical protein
MPENLLPSWGHCLMVVSSYQGRISELSWRLLLPVWLLPELRKYEDVVSGYQGGANVIGLSYRSQASEKIQIQAYNAAGLVARKRIQQLLDGSLISGGKIKKSRTCHQWRVYPEYVSVNVKSQQLPLSTDMGIGDLQANVYSTDKPCCLWKLNPLSDWKKLEIDDGFDFKKMKLMFFMLLNMHKILENWDSFGLAQIEPGCEALSIVCDVFRFIDHWHTFHDRWS